MNGTIFDLVEGDLPDGQKGFMEAANRAPSPKDDSWLNSVVDYGKTILKGAVEGISRLGTTMSPLKEYPKFEEGKLIPGRTSGEQLKQQTETLNELLPTDEGYAQKSIRRGLGMAPTAIANPLGGAAQSGIRSIGAGFAGEGAKALGAPEWAQTAAELTAFIGPDVTKKLLEKGSNKEIIEFGKKMGMTDKEITPLIQSDFKQKWLAKLSPKRGSTQTSLENTRKGLGNAYESIKKSEVAASEIGEVANGKLINGLFEKLNEIPREIRGKIEADLMDLLNNKITGRSMINFWGDINSKFGSDKKVLGTLKEPIKEALKTLSPDLSKDFEMINNLYTKYYPIASKLKPNIASDIVSGAETIATLGSVAYAAMGDPSYLIKMIGEKAFRKVAQQTLLNPHFQQISRKIVDAFNSNSPTTAGKLIKSYSNLMRKHSPEFSDELDKISDEDIIELLSTYQQ